MVEDRNWKTAKIVSIEQITPTVRSYKMVNITEEPFLFKAGQFVTFDLPIHEKKSQRVRSYSVASPPHQKEQIELLIVLGNPSQGGSKFFFEDVHVGTELIYRGPTGSFCLEGKVNHDIVFICTGTGLSPFLSMIEEILLHQKNTQNQFTIVFGCRTKDEIIYYDKLKRLESRFRNLKFIPTLSRETWEGKQGYVHDAYMPLIPTLKPETHFYLCGWRQMIDEARKNLSSAGLHKDYIHFELYG